MGKDSILNKKQEIILGEFRDSVKLSSFYFTGGTALSEYYLQHRESVDLDFFSKAEFDPQIILETINSWSKKHSFKIQSEFIDPTYRYIFEFEDGERLKVDFAKYPYSNLKEYEIFDGVRVDSFYDISVNKFLTINQRTEVKDFVDLYFILEKYNFWQLKDGVQAKFNIEIEPFLMAGDYMKVEGFENLPKMHKELDLRTLKDFFTNQAKKLSGDLVK